MNHRAGWDIGGAHLKLALLSNDTLSVFQWSCPLWKGLHELVACLNVAFDQFPQGKHIHHITMTGELADIFDDRTDGVKQIINTFVQSMPANDELKVFANTEVVEVEQAMQRTHLIASANWLASGHYLSRIYANALFVDIGSTTTDILTVKDGKVCNVGFTDAERLRSGELVYTGVVRSCVNTLCNAMPYHNQLVPMMAENFATSADVYRILQQLPAHADSGETMDGQEKDKVASMRRLARMIGEDYIGSDEKKWEQAAQYISTQQQELISAQVKKYLATLGNEQLIVGAGVGRFLIKKIAQQLQVPYVDFADLISPQQIRCDGHVADCAPAVSLALH